MAEVADGVFKPFMDWMFSSPLSVTYEDSTTGDKLKVVMHEGTVQGAPESTVAYSLTQGPIFDSIRTNKKFANVTLLSNHDDSYIVGPVEEVFQAFELLAERLKT
jgi:hypothetical protein